VQSKKFYFFANGIPVQESGDFVDTLYRPLKKGGLFLQKNAYNKCEQKNYATAIYNLFILKNGFVKRFFKL